MNKYAEFIYHDLPRIELQYNRISNMCSFVLNYSCRIKLQTWTMNRLHILVTKRLKYYTLYDTSLGEEGTFLLTITSYTCRPIAWSCCFGVLKATPNVYGDEILVRKSASKPQPSHYITSSFQRINSLWKRRMWRQTKMLSF